MGGMGWVTGVGDSWLPKSKASSKLRLLVRWSSASRSPSLSTSSYTTRPSSSVCVWNSAGSSTWPGAAWIKRRLWAAPPDPYTSLKYRQYSQDRLAIDWVPTTEVAWIPRPRSSVMTSRAMLAVFSYSVWSARYCSASGPMLAAV